MPSFDGVEGTLHFPVPQRESLNPREEEKALIRFLYATLESPRDALILQLYFGLGTGGEHEEGRVGPKSTFEKISTLLGITRQVVRLRKEHALKVLRDLDDAEAQAWNKFVAQQ